MNTEEKALGRLKRKMEQQKHRQNKRQLSILPPQATGSPVYKYRSTKAKATKKVDSNFPKSPRKKKAAFQNLAVKLFPSETIFKKVHKNPSVLTDAVKAKVVDFYCSGIIPVISRSMKNKHIIRDQHGCKIRHENGDTVKLFCEQHPETKIDCMLDHGVKELTYLLTCVYAHIMKICIF